MQIEEGDLQRMIKCASLIEGNCEYLTCIRHNISTRSQLHLKSLRMLDEYLKECKCKLNMEALLQLFIELAYFLYSCRNCSMSPVIRTEDIRVEEVYYRNEKRFTIVLFYKLGEQKIQDTEAATTFHTLFQYIVSSLENYLLNKQPELEFDSVLELFRRQYKVISDNMMKLIEKEYVFFQCLEQTSLFYEMSTLYRIKNCSILDYIKTDEIRLGHFKRFKTKDEDLVIEYNNEKKRNKGEHESLRTKEREIDLNLNQFFKVINDKMESLPNKNQKDLSYRVKFYYHIKQREKYCFDDEIQKVLGNAGFNNENKRKMEGRRTLTELQYYIQYSSERNSICVKLYLPTINVNVETSDFLMFQSNVLTFEAVNVSIELSEPRSRNAQDKNPPKKVVVFKGTSSFNVKQPPLQKILLLMDITMISSRIYQPQLNPSRYSLGGGKDYQRLATISKKINHYTKLFMKCAKKVYSE